MARIGFIIMLLGNLSCTTTGQSIFIDNSDRFADIKILRYQVPGFANLSLNQKKLAYYLSQAGLSGRDIFWDQNYKHNLTIRRTLEAIIKHSALDRTTQDFAKFQEFTKRVWFANGIHHHYSHDKMIPGFSKEYFDQLVRSVDFSQLPALPGEAISDFLARVTPILYDPTIAPKKVNLDAHSDLVQTSAVNFYENLTQDEVESYYQSLKDPNNQTPVSHGLNAKLIKQDGAIKQSVYKIDGMYGPAIQRIVFWLEKAISVAESQLQKQSLETLVEYYKTGDLSLFDAYNQVWVRDTEPTVDTINGFIEVYDDPLGHTGSYEAVVSIKDLELTKKFGILSEQASWFEQNSPTLKEHKRDQVTGVSYKIVQVVSEAGASSPLTPIGINLPNSDWIRAQHGSKSVSLGNIEDAYATSDKTSGALQEFYLPQQQEWINQHGELVDKLTTGLHEVVGHASGKLLDGISPPNETLKSYASALEEARADLVALYFIGDQHLVDLGLTPSTEVMKAEYTQYMVQGLARQLVRIELGKDIEEAHMRNRQLIAAWAFERGKDDGVVVRQIVDGKTYFVVNDFNKLRVYFGELLREIQRIKSVGDFEAGKNLIETYGVKVDPVLHEEILTRWKKLNLAPYRGFINPVLRPVMDESNNITDVTLDYTAGFSQQMLDYAENYSFLPNYN